jgi:site-specific recombinase XerD
MNSQRSTKRERGVFEKQPGSGVWWIRFIDAEGTLRREKAGSKSAAITLYRKRKTDALEGKKLPKKLRARQVRFAELADDYLAHAKANNEGAAEDEYRIKRFREAFGNQKAEVPIAELREWFNERKWKPATFNRARTVLGSIYKLAIENNKAENNPARLLKRWKVADGRVRFLTAAEENRLRKVLLAKYAKHLPEFEIALNTGMRRKEQYVRIDWACVDFLHEDLFVPESKTNKSRHIDLNEEALAAFRTLHVRTKGEGPIFAAERGAAALQGARHWFEDALAEAEVDNFTWHSLRHTFASRLVMAGVDLRTVADLMGHAKIQMTMRYAHLAPAHKRSAVKQLSAFNAMEKKRQESEDAAILFAHATENPTDTTTDTEAKRAFGATVGNFQ